LAVPLEQFPDAVARPRETRSHGAGRDLERLGDLVVGQVGPRPEEEDLSVPISERGERRGERWSGRAGIEPILRGLEPALLDRIDAGARVCEQLASLRSPVVAEQVRRDPEQPGMRVFAVEVVCMPSPERDLERLRREIVRELRSDASTEVPVDLEVVPVEHEREPGRILVRGGHDLGIREGQQDVSLRHPVIVRKAQEVLSRGSDVGWEEACPGWDSNPHAP
jgi:hypothetical protein